LTEFTSTYSLNTQRGWHTSKFGSHWTGFHEILYLSIFRKSVEKIQVSLKADNNNGYFT